MNGNWIQFKTVIGKHPKTNNNMTAIHTVKNSNSYEDFLDKWENDEIPDKIEKLVSSAYKNFMSRKSKHEF